MEPKPFDGKTGTFSILAMSKRPKQVGIAVASGSNSVGTRVPHVKPGVGVVATQAYTNVVYGVEGLKLLEAGFSPTEALNKLLKEDPEREIRQVAIMDFAGRKAVFTGSSVPEWRGEIVGENCIVIGNLLKNRRVVERMAAAFENSDGDLAWRLFKALEAGAASDGDKRGERSAALVIANHVKVLANLRVDMHGNPLQELNSRLKKWTLTRFFKKRLKPSPNIFHFAVYERSRAKTAFKGENLEKNGRIKSSNLSTALQRKNPKLCRG